MKIFRLQQFIGHEGLALTEGSIPEPGPGDVVIRVRASSVNARDLLVAAGVFGPGVPAGVIPLSDGAGEVVSVGSAVRRVKIGDRVCATFEDGWISGERYDIGLGRGGNGDGMLAEYVLRHEDSVVKLPSYLSDVEAATLPCAAVTAWNGLCVYGKLLPGQTVLVQGTGGVSLFALQFAKLFGARVIATTSSASKAQRLRELGADAVIDYREHPDWEKETLRLTDGEGVDVVVDVVGAATMPKSILSVRRGGRISVIGLMTGVADSGFAPAFFGRFVQFHCIHVGSRDSFEDMLRAMAYHRLKPVISHEFSFEDAPKAYAKMREADHFGKVVIRHG